MTEERRLLDRDSIEQLVEQRSVLGEGTDEAAAWSMFLAIGDVSERTGQTRPEREVWLQADTRVQEESRGVDKRGRPRS